jgi:hypothetical protein
MAFRWKIVAVTVADAQENGTGGYEPFAIGHDEDVGEVVLCKKMEEIDENPDTSKASEVQGGLGEDW